MKKIICLAMMAASSGAFSAHAITYSGQVEVDIRPNQAGLMAGKSLHFVLPRVELSPEAQQALSQRVMNFKPGKSYVAGLVQSELPSTVNNGMQGTPVLNQGAHGSCVTFATTAAIDALLGAGDYISQLCNLELGSYLSIQGKSEVSGWNGSYGSWVLDQMLNYGIIPKTYQKLNGCAGVFDYPLESMANEGKPMSETSFRENSIPISNLVSYETILKDDEALSPGEDRMALLMKIRSELAKGHRLSIGTMLVLGYGDAGALGQYKVMNDTWMINPDILYDLAQGKNIAGHEMVMIGYDDNAVVTDPRGFINRGVFILRNSWSPFAGDQGNYYLTYDYFMLLLDEAHVLRLKAKV